ncbi:unnamed protein product [Cuscuta epithymum]|nr:unnamed protein product [Cuscuta epithymum]
MKCCCYKSVSSCKANDPVIVKNVVNKPKIDRVNVESEVKLPFLRYPLKIHSVKHLRRLSREPILKDHLSEQSLRTNESSLAPKIIQIKQKWVPKAEAERLKMKNSSQPASLGSQIKKKLKHLLTVDKEGPIWRWVPKRN